MKIYKLTTWILPLISYYLVLLHKKEIVKKKKCKKAKWLFEEALQIAEKRREAKGKAEKERYTHLNAEFQIMARRMEKIFKRIFK